MNSEERAFCAALTLSHLLTRRKWQDFSTSPISSTVYSLFFGCFFGKILSACFPSEMIFYMPVFLTCATVCCLGVRSVNSLLSARPSETALSSRLDYLERIVVQNSGKKQKNRPPEMAQPSPFPPRQLFKVHLIQLLNFLGDIISVDSKRAADSCLNSCQVRNPQRKHSASAEDLADERRTSELLNSIFAGPKPGSLIRNQSRGNTSSTVNASRKATEEENIANILEKFVNLMNESDRKNFCSSLLSDVNRSLNRTVGGTAPITVPFNGNPAEKSSPELRGISFSSRFSKPVSSVSFAPNSACSSAGDSCSSAGESPCRPAGDSCSSSGDSCSSSGDSCSSSGDFCSSSGDSCSSSGESPCRPSGDSCSSSGDSFSSSGDSCSSSQCGQMGGFCEKIFSALNEKIESLSKEHERSDLLKQGQNSARDIDVLPVITSILKGDTRGAIDSILKVISSRDTGRNMGVTCSAPMGVTCSAPMGVTCSAPMGVTCSAPMGVTCSAPIKEQENIPGISISESSRSQGEWDFFAGDSEHTSGGEPFIFEDCD